MKGKHAVIRLSALLGLTLLLMFVPGRSTQADLPDPTPPTPVWKELEPLLPPPEGSPPPAPISVQGVSKTFQAVADSEVRQGNPTENYGIEPTMGAGYDNYTSEHRLIQRALLHFDVSTFLPPGTTIHQATLQLYMVGYCDAVSTSYQAYRITDDWSELTTTWNNQPSFAEGYGSTVIPGPPGEPWDWYTFDVTALVQAWINGNYPEYGLMIRGPESPPYQCAFRDFLTKGGGGYTVAPELVVDYTLPAPALAVSQNDVVFLHQCGIGAPDPAPRVIAVQSNDTTLRNWTANVTGGSGWLSLSKTGGKTSSIFPDQIEISVSEITPCPSTVTAQIQVSATSLGNSPQTISVTLQQSENPPAQIYLPLVLKNSSGLGSSGISTTATADRIALIIGVADYFHLHDPATFSVLRSGVWGTNLLGPRSDHAAMEQAFRHSSGSGCTALSGEQIVNQAIYDTIVSLPEEHATKANIDYAIQWIDEREDADTQVLIYFSGHGGSIPDSPPMDEADGKDELLGVYDTYDTPQFVNHVLDDNFKMQLANLETEHLGIIFDACNSGGMEVINPHRVVLAASQEDQSSWESSELEHGVFTYYMLQAMRDPASDTNSDGWLSIQEIYNYARGPVADYVWNKVSEEQDLALDMTTDFNVVQCGCAP
jgi:hypothetical protein